MGVCACAYAQTHCRAMVNTSYDPHYVTAWANDLVSWATAGDSPPQTSLYLSLHRRIVEKVPLRYKDVAEGPLQVRTYGLEYFYYIVGTHVHWWGGVSPLRVFVSVAC